MQITNALIQKLNKAVSKVREEPLTETIGFDKIEKIIKKHKTVDRKIDKTKSQYPYVMWSVEGYGQVKYFTNGNGQFDGEVLMFRDKGQRTIAMKGREKAVLQAFEKSLK